MSAENISYDLKRFAGIKRDYTPEEVERLRGSLKIEYSLCKHQSIKTLFKEVLLPSLSVGPDPEIIIDKTEFGSRDSSNVPWIEWLSKLLIT